MSSPGRCAARAAAARPAQAPEEDGVRVDEVPSGQDREPAALAHRDRGPGVAGALVCEHAPGRCGRAEPVVVDGVPAVVLASRHVARFGTGGVEEPGRVGSPRQGLVGDAARSVGQQLPAVEVEHVDDRASAADRLAERHPRTVGRRRGEHEDLADEPSVRIEHRLERPARRPPHPQRQPLVVAAGLPHELAPARRADRWRQSRLARRARDRRSQPVALWHGVQDRARDGLLGCEPRPRVGIGDLLEPPVGLVELPAVEGVLGARLAPRGRKDQALMGSPHPPILRLRASSRSRRARSSAGAALRSAVGSQVRRMRSHGRKANSAASGMWRPTVSRNRRWTRHEAARRAGWQARPARKNVVCPLAGLLSARSTAVRIALTR